MGRWAGLGAEVDGVQEVAERLRGTDNQKLASYIYGRASEYVGSDHQSVTVALIETALSAHPEPTSPGETEGTPDAWMVRWTDASDGREWREWYYGRGTAEHRWAELELRSTDREVVPLYARPVPEDAEEREESEVEDLARDLKALVHADGLDPIERLEEVDNVLDQILLPQSEGGDADG